MTLYMTVPQLIEAVYWDGGPDTKAKVEEFAPEKVRFEDGELKILAGVDGAQEWVPVPVHYYIVSQPNDRSDIWPVERAYFLSKYQAVGG